jgi:glycerophosphoryl diester phosphodiesterase
VAPVRVLAHRGLRSAGPESSLSSVVAAFAACDGAEVDVLVTADGEAVIRHDERLPDGTPVRSLRVDEARRLLGTGEDGLPRVADLLDALDLRGGLLDLELKVPGAARALAALRPLPHGTVLTSFYAAEVHEARVRLPEVPCGLLVSRALPRHVPRDAHALAVHHPLAEAVRAAHPGARLWAWTVNDAAAFARAAAARCEVVISDDPVAIARVAAS